MERRAEAMARRFSTGAPIRRVAHHPGGHIHDTWFVTTRSGELVLQRLNDRIFADCAQMMGTLVRVLDHLRPRGRVPCVLRTAEGEVLAYEDAGEGDRSRPWRAFTRVPGGVTREVVTTPGAAREVGRGLGRFFAHIQDLPGPPPPEAIPGFKDFRRRRAAFEAACELDAYGRATTCKVEIRALAAHHGLADDLVDAQAAGLLPDRLVHNDAKANNVLLDESTGEALCVIDLDTVGPGTVLFDIGDLLRSATVTGAEDAVDLGALAVRDNLLEGALRGYLAEAGPLLCDGERELVPLAGPLMAYENALRFLTDHLAGDVYFRVSRPRHNLDRARAQLRVLEALDRAGDRVAELVDQASSA